MRHFATYRADSWVKAAAMSIRKREWKTQSGEKRQAFVVDYVDGSGKRRLKTFRRQKDAKAWSENTGVAVRAGTHVPERETVTVNEAAAAWCAACEADGLERGTLLQYRQHVNLHIIPIIGATKLSQLPVAAVRAWQDELRKLGRSADMVKRVTTTLGSIISDAQERGTAASNPVREMMKRRRSRKEKRHKKKLVVGVDIPLPTEINVIIEAAKPRWRPLLLTAALTGLRLSELRGLRWRDIDLKKNELHVRQRADRYNELGPPKSESSQRVVPFGPKVANTLREWRLQSRHNGDGDLVFPTGTGKPETNSNIIQRALVPAVTAAGVVDAEGNAKYTGMHALRHFYASWLINRPHERGQGLPPKVVQERLGHSTIAMTMDTYGHLFPRGDDTDELARAEKALFAVDAT